MSKELPYKYRKYDFSVLSRLAFKEFMKANPDLKKMKKIEFDKIIRTYGSCIAEEIVQEGVDYKPPQAFPAIYVTKYKPRKYIGKDGTIKQRRSIDWKKTKELGKKIYTLNSHTDGYITIITRASNTGNLNLNEYWTFKGARYANRYMSAQLKSPQRYTLLGKYKEIPMLKNDI